MNALFTESRLEVFGVFTCFAKPLESRLAAVKRDGLEGAQYVTPPKTQDMHSVKVAVSTQSGGGVKIKRTKPTAHRLDQIKWEKTH